MTYSVQDLEKSEKNGRKSLGKISSEVSHFGLNGRDIQRLKKKTVRIMGI